MIHKFYVVLIIHISIVCLIYSTDNHIYVCPVCHKYIKNHIMLVRHYQKHSYDECSDITCQHIIFQIHAYKDREKERLSDSDKQSIQTVLSDLKSMK
jgi:hypothetical protein